MADNDSQLEPALLKPPQRFLRRLAMRAFACYSGFTSSSGRGLTITARACRRTFMTTFPSPLGFPSVITGMAGCVSTITRRTRKCWIRGSSGLPSHPPLEKHMPANPVGLSRQRITHPAARCVLISMQADLIMKTDIGHI